MPLIVSDPYENWDEFPKPSLPILPFIDGLESIGTHSRYRNNVSRFLSTKTNIYLTSSGRYALFIALDRLGINEECTVLMPAFHCLSMIAPVLWTHANIRFYKLKKDLQIDFEDVKRKITPETKAVLITHYFGFPQNIDQIGRFCRDNGLFMIEDCAHFFFNGNQSNRFGLEGDVSITSLKKFFPVPDGGALVFNRVAFSKKKLKNLSFIEEIKHVKHLLDEKINWDSSRVMNMFGKFYSNINSFRHWKKKLTEALPLDIRMDDIDKIMAWFDPNKRFNKISRISKIIINHSDISFIRNKRIENFLYLMENLKACDCASPLHSSLKKNIVPYMFPLVLKNPDRDFKILKMKKIPILRWEEICLSDCEVSRYYSKHLIQLPCHQNLKKEELDFIIKAVREL